MTNQARDTLHEPRVAELLARLFAESARSDEQLARMVGEVSPEERVRRMSDPHADYRKFFTRAQHLYMAVSAETAALLYMLARANRARAIVEFGTSFGISTIHLAAALRDNGGGRLIGSELEANKVEQARRNLHDAGLDDLVDVREGDALQTLARELPDEVDLLLLDGHKPLYLPLFDLIAPRLRTGSVVVADNVDASPEFVARVRAAGSGFQALRFGDAVEVALKL